MMAAIDFIPAVGVLYGLPTDENHVNVKWIHGDIWFSYTQRGKSISMHFSAKKHDLRRIREAQRQFCEMVFSEYPWCRMILAVIRPKSVVKLAADCDFRFVASRNGRTYMARLR